MSSRLEIVLADGRIAQTGGGRAVPALRVWMVQWRDATATLRIFLRD